MVETDTVSLEGGQVVIDGFILGEPMRWSTSRSSRMTV